MARTSTSQTTFNSGELTNLLWERVELKYFSTGVSYAENVKILPQGGFTNREGLRDIGSLESTAGRIVPFKASDGTAYDVVFENGQVSVWDEDSETDVVAVSGLTTSRIPETTVAQSQDTMLIFHRDLRTRRVKHFGPTDWQVDNAPFENIPNYDFGADINGDPYSNAVAAEWQVEFVGLLETDDVETDVVEPQSVFTLTISGQETTSIAYVEDMSALAATIEAAILDLPNVGAGIDVSAGSGKKVIIEFSGADNAGDGWAVSGKVINKADAAILPVKKVVGIPPGEPIMSTDRGWPQCGVFYGQRLLMGGLKALPNAWIASVTGDYYNFNERLTADDGPFVVPMDTEGGEAIEHMVTSRNLGIFTSNAEYWIAERALSRNVAPNHVEASHNGSRRGVIPVKNEGALVYVHENGGVISEFTYADVDGNFVSTNLSLLAPHLVVDVVDLALKRATVSTDGNRLFVVQSDGQARMVSILREQEITAFTRLTSKQGLFKAASVNGRNEAGFIIERPDGRRLERLEDGLLLDEAVTKTFSSSATVTGLSRFNGRQAWAIAGNDVHGPFNVSGGQIVLPYAVTSAVVGTWMPPVVKVLPPSRELSPGHVVRKKGRIFKIWLSLVDTTHVAVAANDGALREIDLRKYGMTADMPELNNGFTGSIPLEGFLGFVDEPIAVVSQLRPGRLTVRSITLEATT